ncbi:MAG: CHC2 zinc finger domain-containing protein [Cyclonatronaceae bacterium]
MRRSGSNFSGLCPFHIEKIPVLQCFPVAGHLQMVWLR